MSLIQEFSTKAAATFQSFSKLFALSQLQQGQFKNYLYLLLEWNKLHNLTTITDPELIIKDHFADSCMITQFVDCTKVQAIGDVGSGAGFPGIPLKILNPSIPIYLIEVNTKRIKFLQTVIAELNLNHIEICEIDWRTFLRKTDFPINLFVSRASLHTDELLKMFKPACKYKDALLVYWASKHWIAGSGDVPFLKGEFSYMLDNKKRYYVFFAHNPAVFTDLIQPKATAHATDLNILK